jgi:CubicO group peptidase (beta-lactamase class C family)
MNRSRLLLSSVQNFSSSLEEKEAISEPLENKLYRFQIKNGLPGLSCLISKNYQPIYACNLGHSNLENLSPYQSCTVSRIGSISKVYCMLAIRKLAQEGKIDLNRPIVEYLPWIFFPFMSIHVSWKFE